MIFTGRIALAGLVAGAGIAVAIDDARSHGSMEKPISRSYRCFKEGPEAPITDACKAVVEAGGTQPLYDWMEVNQGAANGDHKALVPDGTLCAGGRDKYVGLDLERSDWSKSNIVPNGKGKYKAVYYATTPHATKYFRLYITNDAWTRGDRLTWSNITRVKTVRAPTAKGGRYNMKFKLPEGTEGRQVLYSVWQRSDSPEAFYSCSDVKVIAASAAASAEAQAWAEEGDVIAYNSLPAGTTVTFRVFDETGGDAETHSVTLNHDTGAADIWPAVLARKVNAASEVFRIGVMDSDGRRMSVEPVAEAAGNQVYRSGDYPGFGYHVDIDSAPQQ